ncbi:hypothetical protein V5799_006604 [Amblyomma americanum]|uniref:Uncharacterized protein n=1 Tax=Amblyomma americanum TaxID=6943 RepID=A0AAQ4DVX7_AMBAM
MTTTQWKRIQRGNFWRTVTLDLAPYPSGTGQPLLKNGNSATFRAWIALMRAMSGQGKETPLTLRYRKYIRSVLGLFGASESRAEELAAAIQEMDLLTLDALGPAMADPEQKILRMSIHNMTELRHLASQPAAGCPFSTSTSPGRGSFLLTSWRTPGFSGLLLTSGGVRL